MLRTLAPIFVLTAIGLAPGDQAKTPDIKKPALSGPFTHENLTIFLVHGPDTLGKRKFLTLDEALEAKKLIVNETGTVNQLTVENRSGEEVFIQAGDIVKGGRQDRVLSVDMIVPAHSKQIAIDSFCVESGRWHQRQGEEAARFSTSKNALSSKNLKMAARGAADQGEVWSKVSELQGKLTENTGKKVKSDVSETSLQLTLENGDVEKLTAEYMKDLDKVISGKNDATGYAFAINGSMNSAEIYGSRALFEKLWPKLVKAAVVEAISEKKSGKTTAVTEADVRRFFDEQAAMTKAEVKKVEGAVNAKAKAGKRMTFETRDPTHEEVWIRKSLY